MAIGGDDASHIDEATRVAVRTFLDVFMSFVFCFGWEKYTLLGTFGSLEMHLLLFIIHILA